MSKETVIWVLVIGVLVSLLLYTCNQNRILKGQIGSSGPPIHDTIHLPGQIKIDTTKGSVKVIPTHQIYYDTVKRYIDSLIFDSLHDYVVISHDSIVHDTVSIPFLTNYPKAPKLLFGSFKPNTIYLDLLKVDGTMETKEYNVDYSKHRYEFFNNQLHAIDSSAYSSFWKSFNTESFLYTLYNPFYKGAEIKVDYSFMYKGRIGLTTFLELSTYQTPALSGGIGLKVKIK